MQLLSLQCTSSTLIGKIKIGTSNEALGSMNLQRICQELLLELLNYLEPFHIQNVQGVCKTEFMHIYSKSFYMQCMLIGKIKIGILKGHPWTVIVC